jgi:ketosteroid isomerase-like protein
MPATIDELRSAWMAAVKRSDPAALKDLLTEDYEVWANGALPLKGPSVAMAAMAGALARFVVEQSLDVVETIVDGNLAVERGIERMTLTPRGGGAAQDYQQRAFLVMRRGADGNWRYARGMTNQLPAS